MQILKDLKYRYYFMCPRKETVNLNFVENLVGLRFYVRGNGMVTYIIIYSL